MKKKKKRIYQSYVIIWNALSYERKNRAPAQNSKFNKDSNETAKSICVQCAVCTHAKFVPVKAYPREKKHHHTQYAHYIYYIQCSATVVRYIYQCKWFYVIALKVI